MRQTVPTPFPPVASNDWPLLQFPEAQQLDNIRAYLDLILLALEALVKIDSDSIQQVAEELKLDSFVGDHSHLWQLRNSNPLRKNFSGAKQLNIEEARGLVLIIAQLAKTHQELIRRAVYLLEQTTGENKETHHSALLGDYLDTFTRFYQEKMENRENFSKEELTQLAHKLLIDLLFYSGFNGYRRLWLALLNQTR
ncbi:conserved hypothetical protein [Gloeothece citriformis PCC 7424]|uniref:DUF3038 domain-containing protein n=1 Tax=Gloeothece citriformis (strain PCC 7424) TaxID=65393 RepID=B7KL12_GLOC7|nr:DUF3038 domain-containing protein [Gloeothece citriformis]ACK72384.1 conserved hypothetical protein [Gloeothece citriformis PCC 7424]